MQPGNAYTAPVQEFGPDQLGVGLLRGLFRDVLARVQGRAGTSYYGGSDADPERTLGGYAPSPQSFHGAANPAATTVVTNNGAYPSIASGIVEGPMSDPVRRIFAARTGRRL